MIPGDKILLGFIVDTQGRSFYMDDSGPVPVLRYQNQPKPLRHMPDGWMDTDIKYARNMKNFGMDRTYTSQYKFVKDGAFIIRSLLYANEGLESKAFFVITRWNPETGIHEMYYRAQIDLTNISPDDYRSGVTVNLIEGGPAKLLKTNEAVTYEIPCNASNPDAKLITMDGVLLNSIYNYQFPVVLFGGFHEKGTITIPFTSLSFEGNSVGIISGSPSFEDVQAGVYNQGSVNAYYINSSNYFFKSYNPITIRVYGSISFKNLLPDVSGNGKLFLNLIFQSWNNTTGTTQSFEVFSEHDIPNGETRTVDVDFTVTLASEEKLFLISQIEAEGFSYFFDAVQLQQTDLKIDAGSRNAVSSTYGITLYDLWKAIINKATNGTYTGDSTLLYGLRNIYATCGDALRGIETAVIKTSLNDFAELSVMRILAACYNADFATNIVWFERKEFAFDNTSEIVNLGEVTDFNISNAKEFVFSAVNVGWLVKDSQDNLGKQEFNDTKNFTTAITTSANVLDLVSKYRSDIFAIEQIRTDYFLKDRTATSKDNDVFLLNTTTDGPDIVVYRAPYTSITGGDNVDTWYNIEMFTPKRILFANGSLLRVGQYAQTLEYIKYQSSERNPNLQTVLAGVTITEKNDERIDTLNAPFAYPFYFKFKTKVPVNFIPLLKSNRGYVTFTVNGIELKGFPMECSQFPVYDEPQEWKLLCSSLVDLSKLISLNDVFQIGGKGMISHKLPMKFVPLNAVYSEQYHFRHMDQDWHSNRIGRYSQRKPFAQKWEITDNCILQFITNGTTLNNLLIYNCKGTIVGEVVPTQISSPAVILPFVLWHAVINWSLYDPNETYYVKLKFGVGADAKEFISEPNELKVEWPNTLFFEWTNDVNKPDMIFNTEVPYTGKMRVEAMIQKFEPQNQSTTYEDQTRDIEVLNGEPYRKWQLHIGANLGTPDWLIDKLNRIMLLTDVTIDGYAYTIDKDAKFELVEIPGSPYAFWTLPIREKNNRAGLDIDVLGVNQLELTMEYNINTIGFSSNQNPNANNQDNIVQIQDIS